MNGASSFLQRVWPTVPNQSARPIAEMSLETLLSSLQAYGKPRVSLLNTGWHSHIEMNTSPAGTRFEVASNFGMPDPTTAARQCLERVRAAVAELKS